ncbi:MAG: carbon storage regulator CsrA [Limisphaerales bacterium]
MLILSRKPGETVVIDGRIRVRVIRVGGDVVKIGIEAPSDVSIHRQEVYDEIQRNNQEAATPDQPVVPKILRKYNNQNTETRNLVAIK